MGKHILGSKPPIGKFEVLSNTPSAQIRLKEKLGHNIQNLSSYWAFR